MTQDFSHTTVLLHPAVDALNIDENGIYVDGTFGRGGHSSLILSKLGANGRLIAFDRDIAAVEYARKTITDSRFTIVHAPFSTMEQVLDQMGLLGKVNGILLDLGVSSPQIDDNSRGFSFINNGPLDMRMDQSQGISARQWLYEVSEDELSYVLWNYGEEKNHRQIARAVCKLSSTTDYENFLPNTIDLVTLIKENSRYKERIKNPATRSFQAIRIKINDELGELERLLESSLKILAPNGYASIISFHSLEDRIVKQFFANNNKGKAPPKRMPILDKDWDYRVYFSEISKAIKPSSEEVAVNIRSRSAVLRWAKRSLRPYES